MHSTCAHMLAARSPHKSAACAADAGPPRRALTCRVKSEDLRGKQTAPIPSAVFNFLALSVMHGHNRRSRDCFSRLLGSAAEARGDYGMSHSAEGANRRCAAQPAFVPGTQTDATGALAASTSLKWGGGGLDMHYPPCVDSQSYRVIADPHH